MSLRRWSLSSRNCCRARARLRHSRMAATIRRIGNRGAICLVPARRGAWGASRTAGDVHKGDPYCTRGSKAWRAEARTAPGRRPVLRRSSPRRSSKDSRYSACRLSSIIVGSLVNEAGRPALTVPPCSRQLIWQTTARLPSRNLLRFCSLPALTPRLGAHLRLSRRPRGAASPRGLGDRSTGYRLRGTRLVL